MTGQPGATIERWTQAILARRSPDDLVAWLRGEYPGAARDAAERGLPLRVNRVTASPTAPQVLRRSAVVTLEFGWDRGQSYAAWTCVAALGPAGLTRLSGRPEALSEVLAREAAAPRPADAEAMAQLLAAAVVPGGPPRTSAMSAEQWLARRQPPVLTARQLGHLDEGDGLAPIDRAAWRELRSTIAPPSLERAAGGAVVVTFWTLEASGEPTDGLGTPFRLRRLRCSVGGVGGWRARLPGALRPDRAGDRAIEVQRDDRGEVRLLLPSPHVLGRPLVIDGVRRRAALVRQRA